MESSGDKEWASKYLLDPLNAPEPSQETGPGTHLNATSNATAQSRFSDSTVPSQNRKPVPSVNVASSTALPNEKTGASTTTTTSARSSNNPYRSGANSGGYPTPPGSASPRNSRFPNIDGLQRQTPQSTGASTQIPTSTGGQFSSIANGMGPDSDSRAALGDNPSGHRRRGSSLTQRHPGDKTHRPLDMLQQHELRATRSPHLRRKHHVGADSIDSLDNVGPTNAYHHEGPYDATLLARNLDPRQAPVAAVRGGNAEALRATPREMVQDSLSRHLPLDGVAMVPPGMVGPGGKVMSYKEGTDMMIEGQPEGGAYKRWPGVKYLPDDLKGKGEPSYSLEKALKTHGHTQHRRNVSESQAQLDGLNNGAVEMTSPAEHRRPLSVDADSRRGSGAERYADWEARGVRRSESSAGKLRKRFGSLRIKRYGKD